MTTMNTEPGEREEAPDDTRTLLRRLKDFLFDNCNHNERDRNYDWCPSCVMVFMEVVSKPSDSDAATRMRERCAQKLRERASTWRKERYMNDLERRRFNAYAEEADNAAIVLESLTLDGEKEQ